MDETYEEALKRYAEMYPIVCSDQPISPAGMNMINRLFGPLSQSTNIEETENNG